MTHNENYSYFSFLTNSNVHLIYDRENKRDKYNRMGAFGINFLHSLLDDQSIYC